jgi:hypothetical protein
MAAAVVAAATPLVAAGVALAHPHAAEKAHQGAGQVIANGQNHPAFVSGESCESNAHLPGYGPAWYGLETAHTGRMLVSPGRATGVTGSKDASSPLDPASDRNPGIR